MNTLEIKGLVIEVGGRKILKGVDLAVKSGEIHALMGPNGSGKSTLAQAVMGHPGYTVGRGSIRCGRRDITRLSPDERARLGLFLSFQYPVEVPGVGLFNFLRLSYNASHPGKTLGVREFRALVEKKLKLLQMDEKFLSRNLNEDFSGGEKKRAEILQLAVLEPKIAILDEVDSGLDIDSLKIVAEGIKKMPRLGVLLITHYQRILRYIKPDKVHVMVAGRIVDSAGPELAERLEEEGYGQYTA